jgi:hypothetical protein
MILVEGKLKSWGRAEMVIKLLEQDLPEHYPNGKSVLFLSGKIHVCCLFLTLMRYQPVEKKKRSRFCLSLNNLSHRQFSPSSIPIS